MLEFDTYRDILDDLEEEIKALDKYIQYRQIQLIGIREILSYSNPFQVIVNPQETISIEEQKILDNDLELQRMKERKKRLEDRRAFIFKTAELPEEDMAETDVFK